MVWDTITQVTGTRPAFYMERPETRAVQIADGNVSNNFLTTFGRSSRGTPCTCEVKTQPTLAQALELVNGDTVSQAIERGGRMRDWLASEGSPQAAARRVYQTALSRDPSDTEMKAFEERLSTAADKPVEAMEDLCWAVLNSSEFLFNH